MVIALIITLPIIAIIASYTTLKAYQLGLQHNYDLKHDTKPIEVNPIREFFDSKAENKNIEEQASIMNEWLNGKEGE